MSKKIEISPLQSFLAQIMSIDVDYVQDNAAGHGYPDRSNTSEKQILCRWNSEPMLTSSADIPQIPRRYRLLEESRWNSEPNVKVTADIPRFPFRRRSLVETPAIACLRKPIRSIESRDNQTTAEEISMALYAPARCRSLEERPNNAMLRCPSPRESIESINQEISTTLQGIQALYDS